MSVKTLKLWIVGSQPIKVTHIDILRGKGENNDALHDEQRERERVGEKAIN